MQATLSHYRILEQIGAGGMGVVYRAHDERLERDVALKVLPAGALADEAARKRFRREALALSRLNHPNIATVLDFDTQEETDFLVEELIEGMSLDAMVAAGTLPQREVIHLGAQLAEGLAAAHERGIVHRDLKPANIRITPDARLKILDFGLAKLMAAGPIDATASFSETQAVSGTLPYMAPEQLLNEKVDTRSDIWAAGCVLYEMATGRRPFLGSGPALTDAILHHAPAAPSKLNHQLSPGLEAVILKCLEKDPDLRYGSAAEIVVDLRRLTAATTSVVRAPARRKYALPLALGIAALLLATGTWWFLRARGAPPPPTIRSLAVLPLANLSGDPQQDYFAEGMTESLITELSKISALKVISRTTAMHYKGTTKSLPEIAQELHVDGVVEGSVLRSGERVRITAQLIHAATDQHLWAESYDRDLRDVLAIHRDVASSIAAQVRVAVTARERERLQAARPVDPATQEEYLKGRYFLGRFSEPASRQATEHLERAVALDPTYAPAYASLALAYGRLAHSAVSLPTAQRRELLARSLPYAQRAVELDPTLGDGHAMIAMRRLFLDWDRVGAEREIRHAMELAPNAPDVVQSYSVFLFTNGHADEAAQVMRQAVDRDPLNLVARELLGEWLFGARRYDESFRELKAVLDMDPQYARAWNALSMLYFATARWPKYLEALDHGGNFTAADTAALRQAYSAGGKRGLLQAQLQILLRRQAEGKGVTPGGLARIYAELGESDKAFAWLEQAFRERAIEMVFLGSFHQLDPIRSDPRFQDLLRRVDEVGSQHEAGSPH